MTDRLALLSDGIDPLRFVARATIEFSSPILIGSGRDDNETDQIMVRDVHGLPLIPASGIAGILSHAVEQSDSLHVGSFKGEQLRDVLFGTSRRSLIEKGPDKGRFKTTAVGSRIRFSDGYFHDASNQPVPQDLGYECRDDVASFGLSGLHRDRVRINGRGTSDERGKFEYVMCPAGARFTFEIDFGWGSFPNEERTEETVFQLSDGERVWTVLLDILAAPSTRMGTSSRSGLGAFDIISLEEGVFWLPKSDEWNDLQRPEFAHKSFADYRTLPVQLNALTPQLSKREIPSTDALSIGKIVVSDLRAEDTWLFGGEDPDSDADITSLKEHRILWDGAGNQTGRLTEAPLAVAPGSAVKGAIVHRTRWHYLRLTGATMESPEEAKVAANDIDALFGRIKDTGGGGAAGLVFFADHVAEPLKGVKATHNSIDRFTNGVRAGFLFDEDIHQDGGLGEVMLHIDLKRAQEVPAKVREAFHLALQDFGAGRLQLGGGTGRGHGAFKGDLGFCQKTKEWLKLS